MSSTYSPHAVAAAAREKQPKAIVFSTASGGYFADLVAKQLNLPRVQIERRVRYILSGDWR